MFCSSKSLYYRSQREIIYKNHVNIRIANLFESRDLYWFFEKNVTGDL
jgi:hypothetical protein